MVTGHRKIPGFTKNDQDTAHYLELKSLVMAVVQTLPTARMKGARLKAVLLPSFYISVFVASLFFTNYFFYCIAYFILGLSLPVMFLNVVHEASHGNLFRNRKLNRYYMLLLDLIGGNSYMWEKRHVSLHHNFINVADWDCDIEKSEFLKVHPGDKKPSNPYQHLMILLYPMFVTNWFLVRDFKDFYNRDMVIRKLGEIPLIEFVKLFFFKFFYVFYMLIVPSLITPFSDFKVLLAFLLMLTTAGFFALFVLLPPHVNMNNQFPVVDSNLRLGQSWLRHQLITTNDVDNTNWFTRHIMANFNFHIAHHLFPKISYVYAEEVTQTIKDYALKVGLPYRSYPLGATLRSHYRLIRNNQVPNDFFEDDM